MHMSDSLLSPAVGLGCAAAAAGMVAYSARKFAAEPEHDAKIPLAGVLGAFIFAGQMLNFALPLTGSSGHIGGGLLLAVLLGPYAAFLTIAAVLVVQCFFFQDGGPLALGCNILNLGFWPCFLALPLYRWLSRGDAVLASPRTPLESGTATGSLSNRKVAECAGGTGQDLAATPSTPADSATFGVEKEGRAAGILRGIQGERGRLPLTFAAVAAVVLGLEFGAFGVVVEVVLSGRAELPFAKFAPLMLGIHLPIAVCEGVMTMMVLRFVERVKPGMLADAPAVAVAAESGRRTRWLLTAFALAALLMAGVGSWFASEKPDGLEWAAAKAGQSTGQDARPPVNKSAEGVVGALATGLLVAAVCGALWLSRRRTVVCGGGGGRT